MIAYLINLLVSSYSTTSQAVLYGGAFALSVVVIVMNKNVPPQKRYLLMCSAVAGCLIGTLHACHDRQVSLEPFYHKVLELTGVISEMPSYTDGRYTMYMSLTHIGSRPACSGISVRLTFDDKSEKNRFGYGDIVRVRGKLLPAHIEDGSGDPVRAFLSPKKIHGRMFINGTSAYSNPVAVEKIGNKSSPIKSLAIGLRKAVIDDLNRYIEKPYNYILEGLLIGDHQHGIPERVTDLFRKTGLSHLLVVSGSQVALVTGMTLWLVGLFTRRGWVCFVVISFVNCLFVGISGGEASIVRAFIMMELTQFALLTGRKTNPVRVLLTVAAIMLSYNPYYCRELGFVLSFLATFGIVVVSPYIEGRLSIVPWPKMRQIISISIAPHIMTMPLILYLFASYPIFSVPLNIVVAPLIEIIVYGGAAAVISTHTVPVLPGILFSILTLLVKTLEWLVSFVGERAYAELSIPLQEPVILVFTYALLFSAIVVRKRPARRLVYMVSVTAILFSFLPTFTDTIDAFGFNGGVVECHVLDVGNGLCCYVRTPEGYNLLIDAGGTPDKKTDRRKILPYLRKQGVSRIDYVIISHAHLDHYEALDYLTSHVVIRQIIIGDAHADSDLMRVIKRAGQYGSIVRTAQQGDRIEMGDTRLDFLSGQPVAGGKAGCDEHDENNLSLVTALFMRDFEILFPGDVEEKGLDSLLESKVLTQMDVLIVPHHGAFNRRIGDLLTMINNSLSVISVAQSNSYGHPHPQTLKTIKELGSRILRTDTNGDIVIKSDGRTFRTYIRR